MKKGLKVDKGMIAGQTRFRRYVGEVLFRDPRGQEVAMLLSLQEREKLLFYTAAKLALERKDKGLKLNLPEATAVITSFLLEGAREGRSVADLMEAGRDVLSREEVMEGVLEMLGHANISITLDTYSHVLPDMQDGAVGRFGEMLSQR